MGWELRHGQAGGEVTHAHACGLSGQDMPYLIRVGCSGPDTYLFAVRRYELPTASVGLESAAPQHSLPTQITGGSLSSRKDSGMKV